MIKTLTQRLLAAAAITTALTASAADDYTKELYGLYCTACHAVKSSGAPQAFTDEWQDRLDQGIPTLVNHAINGIRNMPPMGTCAECSEEDLENLIRYMAKREQ